MEYKLVRSARRSIALLVNKDGEVRVKAPLKTSIIIIDNFVTSKLAWIEKQLLKVSKNLAEIELLQNENEIFYLDGLLTLVASPQKLPKIIGSKLFYNEHKDKKIQVQQVLKQQARILLVDLSKEYSQLMGVTYNDLRLKDNATNWGSCSSKRNLNFNWRIIMAPLEVVKYLVIHELCHLTHMNHSDTFWNRVAEFDPKWHLHDKWLKENGKLLQIF